VNQFAFDKTGTLTKGILRVIEVEPESARHDLLRLAASLGQYSTHPLSRGIVNAAREDSLVLEQVEGFKNLPGQGMEGSVGGETVLIGSQSFLSLRGIDLPSADRQNGDAEVCMACGATTGMIYLQDEIRPESQQTIQWLRTRRAHVALMTGDRSVTAKRVADRVGIEDVRSDMTPADKLGCIQQWQREGRRVAMVGDGINDAPSLTAADVAIVMGARGSDTALEQADVVLMHDKIENLVGAIKLSRRARTIIRQNLAISLGVIAVLVVSALSQKITLSLGVVGHEGSTVIVVLNGLRLLNFKKK